VDAPSDGQFSARGAAGDTVLRLRTISCQRSHRNSRGTQERPYKNLIKITVGPAGKGQNSLGAKHKPTVVSGGRIQTRSFGDVGSGIGTSNGADIAMATFLKILIVVLLVALLADAFLGWLRPDVMPGFLFLPGDIKYESPGGNVRVYFPIVTSIVLSVVLTLILRLFGRFFGR